MLFGEVTHFGVFCCSLLAKGVRFGPFQGKVVNASEVKTYGDNSLMWEVSMVLVVRGAGGKHLACVPLGEGTRAAICWLCCLFCAVKGGKASVTP